MMTIEETTDHVVIKQLCGDMPLPEFDLWVGKDGVTILIAKDEEGPKMAALILDKGETGEPEVHLQAPGRFLQAVQACNGFRHWILDHKPWKTIWSYTVDPDTFRFATFLGFKHAFDEAGRNYIILKLRD